MECLRYTPFMVSLMLFLLSAVASMYCYSLYYENTHELHLWKQASCNMTDMTIEIVNCSSVCSSYIGDPIICINSTKDDQFNQLGKNTPVYNSKCKWGTVCYEQNLQSCFAYQQHMVVAAIDDSGYIHIIPDYSYLYTVSFDSSLTFVINNNNTKCYNNICPYTPTSVNDITLCERYGDYNSTYIKINSTGIETYQQLYTISLSIIGVCILCFVLTAIFFTVLYKRYEFCHRTDLPSSSFSSSSSSSSSFDP
jgi:hypothetical protein